MERMDQKSKRLIVLLFILIGISVAFTFYRTMITKNYPIIEESVE